MLKLIDAHYMNTESVLEYYNSYKNKEDNLCYAINTIQYGIDTYIDWIINYEDNLYYLVNNNNPNYIIGYGNIEDTNIIDYHNNNFNEGNISYGIRESERNKQYGTELLKLLLKKCEELGMKEVCVSCHKDNIGSYKIIKKNNGKLEKEFLDITSGKEALKFWIKLNPKIYNKYKRLLKNIDKKRSL